MDLVLVCLIVASLEILIGWLWMEWRYALRRWKRATDGWEEAIQQRDMLLDVLANGERVESEFDQEVELYPETGVTKLQPKLRAVK